MERLLDKLEQEKLFSSPQRFARYAARVFGATQLSGRDVLDVGCGQGLLTAYAACSGVHRLETLYASLATEAGVHSSGKGERA